MIDQDEEGFFVNIRKLAAVDIALHGSRFIIVEFAFGVIVGAAVGLFLIYLDLFSGMAPSNWRLAIAAMTLFVALNYVPLLLYAISITRQGSAREEVADELDEGEEGIRRYNIQQFLIFVPLAIPILAIYQEWRRRTLT